MWENCPNMASLQEAVGEVFAVDNLRKAIGDGISWGLNFFLLLLILLAVGVLFSSQIRADTLRYLTYAEVVSLLVMAIMTIVRYVEYLKDEPVRLFNF